MANVKNFLGDDVELDVFKSKQLPSGGRRNTVDHLLAKGKGAILALVGAAAFASSMAVSTPAEASELVRNQNQPVLSASLAQKISAERDQQQSVKKDADSGFETGVATLKKIASEGRIPMKKVYTMTPTTMGIRG